MLLMWDASNVGTVAILSKKIMKHSSISIVNINYIVVHSRHAKWVEFLRSYTFHLKHKIGSQHQVADALS